MSLKAAVFSLWLCVVVIYSNAFAHQDNRHQSDRAGAMTDQQGVQRVMKAQFDRPESPLSIPAVSIESGYALASWTQDGRGGRALLKKTGGNWSIHLCGGDGLKKSSTLVMAGMDKSSAAKLIEKLTVSERSLPVEQVKQFSMFEGVIKIDDPRHSAHSTSPSHDRHRK
ncbi:MAG: copper uptake system-associated protein [Burkholderiaceae bacterium]